MDRETKTTVVRDREPSNSLANIVIGLLAVIGLILLFNYFVNARQPVDQTTDQTTTTQEDSNNLDSDAGATVPSDMLSAQPTAESSAAVSQ